MTQEFIVWIIIGIAAIFVARSVYLKYRRTESCCSGCTGCSLVEEGEEVFSDHPERR